MDLSIVAVDPGTKGTGWASYHPTHGFDGGVIVGLKRAQERDLFQRAWDVVQRFPAPLWRPSYFVGEVPSDYSDGGASGNSLMPMVGVSMGIATRCRPCQAEFVLPSVWKKQLRKSIHHARVLKRLPPAWQPKLLGLLEGLNKGPRLDLLDAVCLLWWGMDHYQIPAPGDLVHSGGHSAVSETLR